MNRNEAIESLNIIISECEEEIEWASEDGESPDEKLTAAVNKFNAIKANLTGKSDRWIACNGQLFDDLALVVHFNDYSAYQAHGLL